MHGTASVSPPRSTGPQPMILWRPGDAFKFSGGYHRTMVAITMVRYGGQRGWELLAKAHCTNPELYGIIPTVISCVSGVA